MEFDPFIRGPFPVAVRSGQLVDSHRDDRQLPFEVWYPTAPRYFGLDPAAVLRARGVDALAHRPVNK